MEEEGTLHIGFDLEEHLLSMLEASLKITDPHEAFHVCSALPMGSSLCARCGADKS